MVDVRDGLVQALALFGGQLVEQRAVGDDRLEQFEGDAQAVGEGGVGSGSLAACGADWSIFRESMFVL